MRRTILTLTAGLMLGAPVHARDQDLTELDLATLMTMDVMITSAAKHAQVSSDAAAAVYVVTREDIRRSGANSIPELLRYVPGLQVARINTRSWSVTSRGFGTRFANKLLVMVDGRSVYSPVFSGVMWEEHAVPLDAIERIEVVRGPGGALWGINAVNGVINIITRQAADSPGLHLESGRGSEERDATVRYAGEVDGLGAYRVYVGRGELDALGAPGAPLDRTQGGLRVDRSAFGGAVTFEAEIIDSDFGAYDGLNDSAYPRYSRTQNVLLDWSRELALGDLELLSFYSGVDRSDPGEWNEYSAGLEAQFSARRLGRHVITAGAGLRRGVDEQDGVMPSVLLTEQRFQNDQWSVYAQDELHFRDDALRLILGAKLENFEVTGLALQPTVRAIWKYNEAHTFWTAVSRALRTPSRFELHAHLNLQIAQSPPTYYTLSGDQRLQEEELEAYEFGWRWRPTPSLSFDLALYHNAYSNLIGIVDLPPQVVLNPSMRIEVPAEYANGVAAHTRGAELAAEWQPRQGLRLQAAGALFSVETKNALDVNLMRIRGPVDPEKSLSLRARMDLMRDAELDLAWRYVDALPGLGIGSYGALDVRAAWRATPRVELSFAVSNALDDQHVEFEDEIAGVPGVALGRTYLGRVVWRPF